MLLKNIAATTALTAFSLFSNMDDVCAQTPSLKPSTPHYLLGVPLPSITVGGRLLKPVLRISFPASPKHLQNKKDITVTQDGRAHPALNQDDFLPVIKSVDTLRTDYIPPRNLG